MNEALAHPREILKSSILSNAANMIICHCHPSGSLSPSKFDTMMTDRMIKLCDMVGIPLMDSIIVGGDNSNYFSFREKGIMPNPNHQYCTDYQKICFDKPMGAEKERSR